MRKKYPFYVRFGAQIAERDGGGYCCHYCGAPLIPPGVNPNIAQNDEKRRALYGEKRIGTVDHVIPQSKGGGDDLSNFVLACRECNSTRK
jgi:5-methylcytosine-specific restriction endonuclease McrA